MSTHTDSADLPQETRIGRTALRVGDRQETTRFYRDVVGLAVQERSEAGTVLGTEDAPLLVLETAPTTPDRERSGAGLYHNAFRVPSRAALGDALRRLRDRWRLDGASDHGVSEALYATDPEGNGVEIYRDFPRAEWPVTDDGRLRMGTEPLDLAPLETAAAGKSAVPPATDVGHVHLEVTSLERVRAFLVDAVGFAVEMAVPSALFVAAGGYHHHVGANTWHHRSGPARGLGLAWFEVLVPDAAALDAVRDRVTASEYPVTGRDDGFAVTGPDDVEVRFRVAPPNSDPDPA